MPEDAGSSPTREPQPPSEASPPPATPVELGEGVRKGTHVMPELSVPADFDPPSAAPIATAPASSPAPAEPAGPSSDGSDGSSSSEK